MLYFNSCQKCETGTVEAREGLDGPEFKCLNCGFANSFPDRDRVKTAA